MAISDVLTRTDVTPVTEHLLPDAGDSNPLLPDANTLLAYRHRLAQSINQTAFNAPASHLVHPTMRPAAASRQADNSAGSQNDVSTSRSPASDDRLSAQQFRRPAPKPRSSKSQDADASQQPANRDASTAAADRTPRDEKRASNDGAAITGQDRNPTDDSSAADASSQRSPAAEAVPQGQADPREGTPPAHLQLLSLATSALETAAPELENASPPENLLELITLLSGRIDVDQLPQGPTVQTGDEAPSPPSNFIDLLNGAQGVQTDLLDTLPAQGEDTTGEATPQVADVLLNSIADAAPEVDVTVLASSGDADLNTENLASQVSIDADQIGDAQNSTESDLPVAQQSVNSNPSTADEINSTPDVNNAGLVAAAGNASAPATEQSADDDQQSASQQNFQQSDELSAQQPGATQESSATPQTADPHSQPTGDTTAHHTSDKHASETKRDEQLDNGGSSSDDAGSAAGQATAVTTATAAGAIVDAFSSQGTGPADGAASGQGAAAATAGDLAGVQSVAADGRTSGPQSAHETTHAEQRPAVNPTEFVERVSQAMRSTDANGGQLRIRLHPPELGTLQIEVTSRGGALTARLEVQTPGAQQTLLEHMSLLRESLAHQGTVLDRIDVQIAPQYTDERGGDWSNSQQQQQRDADQQPPNDGSRQQSSHSTPEFDDDEAGAGPNSTAGTLKLDQLDIQI